MAGAGDEHPPGNGWAGRSPGHGVADPLAGERRRFTTSGWCTVQGLVPPAHVAALASRYRRYAGSGAWRLGDVQVARRHSWKDDPVARAFHEELTTPVAAVTGRPLVPSYSFVCAYEGGAVLDRHVDRPQCEVTLSLAPDRSPLEAAWPLRIHGPDGTVDVHCGPGDGAVFHRSLPHSRPRLADGATWTTVLFHWVDEGFPGPLA